jgi:hypothetical protein
MQSVNGSFGRDRRCEREFQASVQTVAKSDGGTAFWHEACGRVPQTIGELIQMRASSLTKPEQFVVVDDNTFRVDFLKKDRLTIPDLAVVVPARSRIRITA